MQAKTRRARTEAEEPAPQDEIVRTPKLSHLVAERLRAQIASGELASGDTLPAEAELLKRFRVSRPTLRETLRILESEQLIQLGRGTRHGAVVLGPSIGMAAQYGGLYLATHGTTLGDIHQVRMLLEPPLASLLAMRKDKRFLQDLQACIRLEQEALRDHDYVAAVGGTNNFHRQLVNLSENQALRLLAGMVHDMSASLYPQIVLAARRGHGESAAQRTARSVESHATLVQLLRASKAAEAERFWRGYMQATAEWLEATKLAQLRIEASTSQT
jgi:DNA-binding FadR family transcriptional regulator